MQEANNAITISGLSKRFGVVQALNNVSFSVRKGEIHTLLGENGAGKSTLVKILMGEQAPDEGVIKLDGEVIKEFHPLVAQKKGIQMVHQELAIFENMTVAENMFPQYLSGHTLKIDYKTLNQKAKEALNLFGLKTISPSQKMDSVNLAGQQIVEILRCIQAKPKVLLLDEPTSGLNDEEANVLMALLRRLKAEGLTIIYISHRLKEIMEISDRVTVMRDGQYIATFDKDQLSEQTLINSMVGRELSDTLYRQKIYGEISDEVIFEVSGFRKKKVLEETSFCLHKNEVVGFFGLEGSGTDRFSRMIFGLESKDAGTIRFNGEVIRHVTPTNMIDKGIMYLNNNRKNAGLLLDMSVNDNISIPLLRVLSNAFTFINRKKLNNTANEYIDKFSIVVPSGKTSPRNLSGGNQQKVMMAICSAPNPKLLIVNEPTRGIDVGVKSQIHQLLSESSKNGMGIIVFSSELPELISMCDRVIVMRDSKIAGEVVGNEISEQSIMFLASIDQEKRGTENG